MKKSLTTLIVIVSLLLCWQALITMSDIPPYILPTPLAVAKALAEHQALIASHFLPTLFEMLAGLVLGIIFGILAGIMIVFYRPLSLWFLPLLIISQAIPTFAIAPLLVIWLGYGMASKIAVTALMIFFPIASCIYDGLRQTPTGWLQLAKTMDGTAFRIFFHIKIPAALPHLASGLRIAVAIAPIGAIVGEWVGSSAGLGFLMLNANARLQIDMMFAVLMVIMAMSLVLYFVTDKILQYFVWWKGDLA